jgi:hypothetical protein
MTDRELANTILFETEESKMELIDNFILVIDEAVSLLEKNQKHIAIDTLNKVKKEYVKMIIEKMKFKPI